MSRLAGRVALVTGGSRGIGRAMALALAREGAAVILAARTERDKPNLPGTIHSVAEEVAALGGRALAVPCDVRNDADLDAAVTAVRNDFGRLDILVHNAGALWWTDVLETPVKRFDLVMDVNVRAAFVLTRLALPLMIASGGGHIVTCSPPIELAALPGRVAYLISKFGMTMMALGLAEELRAQNVAANALWPATAIETAATINFGVGEPATWRTPDIVADALVEIVATPPAALTGRALIDEDFLRERGWTDFTRYRSDPAHEPPRYALRDLPKAGRVTPPTR